MSDASFSSSERRIALLEKALTIYSPSGNEKALAALLYAELKELGLNPKIDSAGNVVCEAGSGKKSLLFCGHMDTVPGEMPVKRVGDWLYGRGACDAKGPLLSLLFAFEDTALKLNENAGPGRNGRLIFTAVVEEEGESSGLNQLMKDSIRADYAIFGEPGGLDRITLGYRGHLTITITVETQEVHSSAPWLTTNSIEAAMAVYSDLKNTWPEAKKGESKTASVSVSLTRIHGGSAHNVTPGKTTMTVDIRLPIGTNSARIKTEVEKIIGKHGNLENGARIDVSYGEATEPYRAGMDSTLVRSMNRALLKSGVKPTFITKSGTGDMNTYALGFGVEAITYGPGDTRLSHTTEEKIDAKEVLGCSAILYSALEELFS